MEMKGALKKASGRYRCLSLRVFSAWISPSRQSVEGAFVFGGAPDAIFGRFRVEVNVGEPDFKFAGEIYFEAELGERRVVDLAGGFVLAGGFGDEGEEAAGLVGAEADGDGDEDFVVAELGDGDGAEAGGDGVSVCGAAGFGVRGSRGGSCSGCAADGVEVENDFAGCA